MRALIHRGLFLSLLLIMLLALMTLVTGASENGIRNASENSQRKIVVFRTGTEELQDKLLEKHGLSKIRDLEFINAKAAFVPKGRLNALKAEPAVLRVEKDVKVFALGRPEKPGKTPKDDPPEQPDQETPWGIEKVNADNAWSKSEGDNVKIAIIDSGIDYNHPDLNVSRKDGINTINRRKSFYDDYGHGTHVAGTIAAQNNDIGVVGVSYNARLYGVKALSKNGSGWVSDIIEGIEWSIENDMDVINMSLGSETDVQSFEDAVDAAYEAGVVVVAAAGNSYDDDKIYPGAYENVICVSATTSIDTLANFSTRGDQVDIGAPGASVKSTVPEGGYYVYSGTSMASPHVAGVVAMIIDYHKIETENADSVEAVKTILYQSADDSGNYGNEYYFGAGLVDAQAAVN